MKNTTKVFKTIERNVVTMNEDMRGLFVIVKGQYRHKCEPRFFNKVSQDYNCLGGYDPEREETSEWYMLYDRETLTCHGCSSDFDKVVSGVFKIITRYRSKEKFVRKMRSLDQPRSPIHECLMKEVIDTYGDYYEEEIEDQENEAYKVIREDTPLARTKKRLKKREHTSVEMEKKTTPVVIPTTPKHTSGKKKGLIPKKRKTSIEFE